MKFKNLLVFTLSGIIGVYIFNHKNDLKLLAYLLFYLSRIS